MKHGIYHWGEAECYRHVFRRVKQATDCRSGRKGGGQYYSTTIADYFHFDVTADVNFADHEVIVTATNTCHSYDADDCEQAHFQQPDLDFTGTLNYTAGENAITGSIETTGGDEFRTIIRHSRCKILRTNGGRIRWHILGE